VSWLTRHRLSVRFSDCDLLGHVNNAVYLTYLEQARIGLWRDQLGFLRHPPAEGAPRGPGFILARAEVDFRAQARYADELEVRITLGSFGRSSCTYDYEIVRLSDDTLIAAAKTVQVWFDYDAQKPVAISDALKATLATPVSSTP
jgi:acyl-CoA thioester hydrolase